MPAVNSMVLPLPEDAHEFEKMVRDAFALKWNSPNLQIIGRSGQSQSGVDVFGDDELGRSVGIQCKLYKSGLSIKTVEAEVKRAEEFKPPVATLYIATTYPNDSKLQQTVRLLSKERVAKGMFSVGLLFWSDIVAGLVLNRATLQAYYPQIQLKDDPIADTARLDACLDLGYYGAHVKSFVELILGEFGWMGGEDPRQLEIVLELIENSAFRLLPEKQAQAILELTRRVHASLFNPKKTAFDIDSVVSDSSMIAKRVRMAHSFLASAKESIALGLGVDLGAMHQNLDDIDPGELGKMSIRLVEFLPPESEEAVRARIEQLRARSSMDWGSALFSLASSQLKRVQY